MKREIILIIVVVLAIIGLEYKNKQIDKLEERQRDLLTEVADYKWKYEHLEYICNEGDENENDN